MEAALDPKATQCRHHAVYEELDEVIRTQKRHPGALIQILHWVQENLGYIPRDVQVKVADELGLSLSDVYGVVSFYSFFTLKPRGEHTVSCCKGTACYVRGAPEVIQRFEKELGIKPGDTTDDGKFSFEVVRCLGACGLAPVMTVDKDTHGRMKADRVPQVLKKYRDGD